MRYSISYDLVAPGKNYQPLHDALAKWGAKRILMSEWVVRWNSTTAASIRDAVRTYTDADDRVMVICLDSGDWAGWSLMTNPNSI